MTRPLYLGASVRNVVLDGPALLVEVEGRAGSRVPLRQLDRVVSRQGAEWSTTALVACLTAGVPVVFLAGDGSVTGHCIPARQQPNTLAQRLDTLGRHPDGVAIFANWAASEQRWAILALVGRPGLLQGTDLRPERLPSSLLADMGGSPEWLGGILRGFEGLLAAHLSALLLASGFSHRHAAPTSGGSFDLFAACFAAARWDLFPALRDVAKHRQIHPRTWRDKAERARCLARRYESVAPRVAAKQRRRILRLDQWLWEIDG